MTSFTLKVIALISMFFDHVGYFIYNGMHSAFNYVGRFAFPIFAYQISEGYTHTHNLKKYFSRLFVFALISQIPFTLFYFGVIKQLPISEFWPAILTDFRLNIFFTLFLGLLCIFIFDKLKSKILGLACVATICFLGNYINVDYGYWGILLIFMFYTFKNNKALMAIMYAVMCFIKYANIFVQYNFYYIHVISCVSTFLAIIPILLYNGKLGPKTKKLLYIFYPTHLLLIYFATLI